jgi:mannose-1-phosphate guanylyltransferase / mannose-6-phosphate isomerase
MVAATRRIVTVGIEPTDPATNYGYIRPGEKRNGTSVLAVEAFVENARRREPSEPRG